MSASQHITTVLQQQADSAVTPAPGVRADISAPARRDQALTFPICLRCASVHDLLISNGLEDAVARALGRAFGHARRVLPAADVLGGGVVLRPPELVRGELPPGDEAALLERLGRAIGRAAQSQALRGHGTGSSTVALRQPDPQTPPSNQPKPEGITFYYYVRINRVLDSGALLLEFVKQYHGLTSDADAVRVRDERGWDWTGTPPRVTPTELRRGYVRIVVRDRRTPATAPQEHKERNEYFYQLPPDQQDEINREADRQFWDRARYRVGEKLDGSREDRAMAPYWRALRDELIHQRQAIENLPKSVQDLLFVEGGRPLAPRDYGRILRLADKLGTLNRSELDDLRDRMRGQTGDWVVFEETVDTYIAERQARRQVADKRERLATPLTGQEALYKRYRAYHESLTRTTSLSLGGTPMGVGAAIGSMPSQNQEWRDLTAALQEAKFASIDAFVAAIEAWRNAFRIETINIADDLLDHYERTLDEAERQYRAAGGAELYKELTPARQHYEEADRIREEFFATGGTATPWTGEELAYSGMYQARRNEQLRQGYAAVGGLAERDRLIRDQDFPREDLARQPLSGVASFMLEYVDARRKNIRETRGNLISKPDMVYKLDKLLEASYKAQEIQPGSIFDMIIRDYAHDLKIDEAIITLGITVIALALGLLSGGTGTVAVLAAGASFGIGVAGAIQEYRKYEEESAAHGAQLLSDDPSFAWVIVAVVGAGLDLAGVVSSFGKSAELLGAVESFNETRDIMRFRQQLDRLNEVNQELRNALKAAGEAEAAGEATRAARLAEWFPQGAMRGSLFLLDRPAEFAVRLAYGAYLTTRRGIRSFRRFLLQREARALLGEIGGLTPAQISNIGRAYEDAIILAERIANHGRTLGMRDQEIEQFFRLWSRNERLTAEQLMGQMDEWAANLGGGAGRYRTAPEIIVDPQSRALLTDFDRRIAGTGGIERITARRVPGEGRLSVTIEGEIRPGLARRAEDVASGRTRAPNFNTSRGNLFTNAELGLSDDWQVLHLWGPGFGDEAAAGMMRGPRSVNYVWQNQSIESYIRQLGQQARREGGAARLKATAIAWETPTPRGWHSPRGELFLKRAQYEVTLSLPGRPSQTITVTLDVAEPPAARIAHFAIDPPSASNLADLFPIP